jgi:hypothetical protein
MLEDCFFWCEDIRIMDQLRLLNKDVRLMARRYDFKTLKATIERHQPQVIGFNGLNFTEEELEQCRELGILYYAFLLGFRIGKVAEID